ncbi:THUMP domain-containing protein 2 [Lampris incognitus]|uniref:THUMP domain-containing protein 2 n=1 Tax=Lampris incognitus TaxID=2546036 RepID=UPI0024B49049|nr:THUMP domain-containing protein 2 [Lampris incognitus]
MTEPERERSLARYCCTAGNGMEPFLAEEVKRRLSAEDVCQIPGRLLFSSSAPISKVTQLKSAERLFLLLRQDSPVKLPVHTSQAKVASVLQARLLGNRREWSDGLMTWSRLQRDLAVSCGSAHRPNPTRKPQRKSGSPAKEKEIETEIVEEEEEEGKDRKSKKRKRELDTEESLAERKREVESGVEENEGGGHVKGRCCGGGWNETQTLEQKRNGDETKRRNEVERKRDGERRVETGKEKEKSGQISGNGANTLHTPERKKNETYDWLGGAGESCGVRQNGASKAAKRKSEEDGDDSRSVAAEVSPSGAHTSMTAPGMCSGERVSGSKHTVPGVGCCPEVDDMVNSGLAVEGVEHVNTTKESVLQPSPPAAVSFRVNCKCTGSLSRCLSAQEVSCVFAAGLRRLMGWKSDLKNPQLEVNLNLSDDHCILGIPLTRSPLSNRRYMKHTGVRSTVAWAMTSLAHIQPGYRVVDPMCGVGTILIEAAQEHQGAHFLGVDIDDRQLQKANENILFADLQDRIQVMQASAMELPLPNASVDAVVCDLPFGRKFGTKTDMAATLLLLVAEMERILRVGGTLVILLSPQLSCLLKKLQAQPETELPATQEEEPWTGLQSPPFSAVKQENQQTPPGNTSSTLQQEEPCPELKHRPSAPLCSLKHQATYRVGLGVIDGLINKYVKYRQDDEYIARSGL